DLKLYTGTIDGLVGPQTIRAVEAYQTLVGLEPTGKLDGALLRQLGTADTRTPRPGEDRASPAVDLPAAAPSVAAPLPLPRPGSSAEPVQTTAVQPDPYVMRIQAGLKAFGNDGIELDGIVGPRTRNAIREFQSLFGLPETGEPDPAVYAKMR